MIPTIRSALLVLAALSASSVAPAQVGPSAESLVTVASATVPAVATPVPLDAPPLKVEEEVEPLAPEAAEEAEPVQLTGDLKTLVSQLRSSDPGSRELECLATGIYFESKGEPLAGQLAVGEVIANRAESGKFPSTYCEVLLQRRQFSFVRGGKLPSVPRSSKAWKTAVAVAKIVDQDLKDSEASNALFFHAKRVSPGWRRTRVASIGNHIFYR